MLYIDSVGSEAGSGVGPIHRRDLSIEGSDSMKREEQSVAKCGGDAAAAVQLGGKPTTAQRPIRVLRFRAVRDRTGLSRSTIWRLERSGTFPRHRRISLNAVGWIEDEVDTWIRSRATQ